MVLVLQRESKPLPRRKGTLILLLQPVSLLGIWGEYRRGLGEKMGKNHYLLSSAELQLLREVSTGESQPKLLLGSTSSYQDSSPPSRRAPPVNHGDARQHM